MIRIDKARDCCGCGACAQICPRRSISMQEDHEGFLYPIIDLLSCNSCGLCERVCPVVNQSKERNPLHVFAAKNRNEQVRMASSSGGIFTLLAEKIIEKNGVVFGAKFNKNWEVVHDYTQTINGLSVFRGSKYVQSRTEDSFKLAERFLKEKRPVLFSGTPCQISGLKLFLQKEYDNLLTVDFVCHGVPSPKVWRYYLNEIIGLRSLNATIQNTFQSSAQNPALEITDIAFRDKSAGWKKFGFVVRKVAPESGSTSILLSEILTENVYMKGFLRNLYLRPSCYCCPARSFKSGSDITIGDFWGIQRALPDFDDDKGVSLVMINSANGLKVFQGLALEFVETSLEDALKGNPFINVSAQIPAGRSEFFTQIDNNPLLGLVEKLTSIPLLTRVRNKIVSHLSAIAARLGFKSIISAFNKR